jgi:Uma2 family endonuclease
MATATERMTVEEFLALPDDGVRRWLIRGQLREEGQAGDPEMTVRNRFHSFLMANFSYELGAWRRKQPKPWGHVVCGEAGVRFPGSETTIGVDAAYVPHDVLVTQTDESTIIEGVPTLIIEILSPSTKMLALDEKIDAYLDAGVAMLWIVDPRDETVTIYQPSKKPTLVNADEELTGGTVLPGFSIPVAQLFE